MKTILTNAGRKMLAEVLDGASIQFTHAEFGDGQWTTQDETILRTEIANATGLRHKVITTDFDNTDEIATVNDGIGTVEVKNGFVLLKSSFLNTNLEGGFHVTEIGYYVRNLSAEDDPATEDIDETDPILYAVCVRDQSEAPYVAPASVEASTFKHACHIYVGDEADVTAIIAANMEEVSKPYVDAHIQRTDNPHSVTKTQVDLGRVRNEYMRDLRPDFTEADTFENIDGTEQSGSGNPADWYGKEPLHVLFGKIQRAITEVMSHFNNKNNPHEVTAAQVKAAAIKHYHDAGTDFNTGILPTIRGGNGTSSGYGFTGSGYKCRGYAYLMGEKVGDQENRNRLLIQWGRVNVDGDSAAVSFEKKFANTDYALMFPTCGEQFIPVWKNPTLRVDGFTMNKTFGINSTAFNAVENVPIIGGTLKSFFNKLFSGSQTADWFAIGQAAD